jgi:hypothetical protein
MLLEAAGPCSKGPPKKSAGWDYAGIKLDGDKFWVGVDFSDPEKLWFGTRCKIDPGKVKARKYPGEVHEDSWVVGGYRWWYGKELDSESVHFFSRSKVGQQEWLQGFLNECLKMARSIETSK